jgi:hypothetical protein
MTFTTPGTGSINLTTAAILFCVVTVASTPQARADLIYENILGAGLIDDTSTDTTWTQNADISGLNLASLPWELPTSVQFTSLYTDLFPVGGPGLQDDKFGVSVSFDSGPNDQALNLQTTYLTSASGADFNFLAMMLLAALAAAGTCAIITSRRLR